MLGRKIHTEFIVAWLAACRRLAATNTGPGVFRSPSPLKGIKHFRAPTLLHRSLAMNTRLLFGSLVLIFAIGCSGRGPGTTEQPGPPEVTVAHPAVAKLTETTDLTGT